MRHLAALAFALLIPALAPAAAPVCALLDPEKPPQAALLEAKLLADSAGTWVERVDIDKVLKEQKLQAMFSPQGVGERVKLGKLLKADVLVMVRSVKDAKEPALEVVVSETAGGLRLLVRAVPLTKNPNDDVAALLAATQAGIKRHSEKITEVVAVPPFVSQNLEFTHEHLRAAFAKLAEAEALDRKGVVVVELEEAEALAKEIALAAPGSKLDRQLPVYLLGEYRHSGKGKELSVSLKLKAERGGKPVGKPASLTLKPEETPGALRKWAAETIDALAKDDTPRPLADPKADAKLLAERARIFRRLGNWPETLALAEASLLLDPDQTDLYADAHMAVVAAIGPVYAGAWLRNEADSSVKFGQLYSRALAHLEQFLLRGGDLRKYTAVGGGGLMMNFQLAGRDLTIDRSVPPHLEAEIVKLREERRATYLRVAPVLGKDGERLEVSLVHTALRDLPLKERYELLDKVANELEDLPYPRARTVMYACIGHHTPADTPELQALLAKWSSSKKKFLQEAAAELKEKLAATRKLPAGPPLYSTDPNPPDPNAPGPEAVKLKPLALPFAAPPVGRVHRPLVGLLALGKACDLMWSADAMFLMKEKGKPRTIWNASDANDWARGGFASVAFDGKHVWAAYNRLNASPLLLLIDPTSEKVIDASNAEGLPNPPPSTRPEDFNTGTTPRLLVNTLEPGRAVMAGSFFNRAWVGVATFDPKTSKVAVKVIHEARDAQDPTKKEQWTETNVSFMPSMVYPVSGKDADGKPATRVIVGRIGGVNPVVWDHPLIFDVDKGSVEPMRDRVWGWPGQGCATVDGAIYFVEPMLVPERTRHLVRLGFPGPGKQVIAERLAPASGTRVVHHEGQFHITIDQSRQQPPEKGPFTPTNPYMIRQSQWWTVSTDGKTVRQVATKLPVVQMLAVSSHYGLVAVVEPEPGKPPTLNTVEIAEPEPKK